MGKTEIRLQTNRSITISLWILHDFSYAFLDISDEGIGHTLFGCWHGHTQVNAATEEDRSIQ